MNTRINITHKSPKLIEEYHSYGDVFKIDDSNYTVALIQIEKNVIQATCLEDMNRWSKPVPVNDINNITREELEKALCRSIYTKVKILTIETE